MNLKWNFKVWPANLKVFATRRRLRPRWAAYGGNGSVVDMDTSSTTGSRFLIQWLSVNVPDLFPNVDDLVLQVVSVQYVASLIELENLRSKDL